LFYVHNVGECRDILLHSNIYVASLASLQIWKKKALALALCIKPTTLLLAFSLATLYIFEML
jgi:hypothetical protein